jgi:hypothetical protein
VAAAVGKKAKLLRGPERGEAPAGTTVKAREE